MVYSPRGPLDGGRVPLVVKGGTAPELSLEGGRFTPSGWVQEAKGAAGLWCPTGQPRSPVGASRLQNLQLLPTVGADLI